MSISKQAEQIREISGVNPQVHEVRQMFRILPVVQRNGH